MDRSQQIAKLARHLYVSAQAQREQCRCRILSFDHAPNTTQSFYVRLACDIVARWSLMERLEMSA